MKRSINSFTIHTSKTPIDLDIKVSFHVPHTSLGLGDVEDIRVDIEDQSKQLRHTRTW